MLSYVVLAFESSVFLLFTFSKNSTVRNVALILLIISVLLARPECGFLSLLAILGYTQAPADSSIAKFILAMLVICFSSLIILRLAYP